jgi:L-serine dehydratase
MSQLEPEIEESRQIARSKAPISVFDLFTVGIGPSSSHTVGPMRAAFRFAEGLGDNIGDCVRIEVRVFGSLALTGKGHRTDIALLLGLSGWLPETIDPNAIETIVSLIRSNHEIPLAGKKTIRFHEPEDLLMLKGQFLPAHSNALMFLAISNSGVLSSETYYSIGGGAIVKEGDDAQPSADGINFNREPYPFSSAAELLKLGNRLDLSIAEIILRNEGSRHEECDTFKFLDSVRDAMMESIDRGCINRGILPGGLGVKRRAADLCERLKNSGQSNGPLEVLEWVNLYALAVNEENAAGGRVVTAPTNGAAGVIPAVLKYHQTFFPDAGPATSRLFLLTASAIGMLFKKNASISAAEMGCQGEVGVACSMAAAGLTAVLGGSNEQIENAAEIGMEHNLGLTCDPIGGLVQIPCIERNTMGAVKAINASMLALRGDGTHHVSLDAVIETMRQTGRDMRSKYKETSLGGLATNVVDC